MGPCRYSCKVGFSARPETGESFLKILVAYTRHSYPGAPSEADPGSPATRGVHWEDPFWTGAGGAYPRPV